MAATLHGFWGKEKTVLVGSLTVSGSNTVAIAFGGPVAVKRLILVTTTALPVADSKLTVGARKQDDTSSTDHSAYTATFSGSAINDVKEILLGVPDTAADATGSDSLDVFSATPVLLEIDSSQEIHITSDGGSTAGAVVIYAQVQELGFHTGAANTNTSVLLVREDV